jgi:cytochrome c peroxidase
VLAFYDEGNSLNPNVAQRGNAVVRLSRNFRRVDDMSEQEQADIIAFLEALTDPDFDRAVPARVPSALPPGGLID